MKAVHEFPAWIGQAAQATATGYRGDEICAALTDVCDTLCQNAPESAEVATLVLCFAGSTLRQTAPADLFEVTSAEVSKRLFVLRNARRR